MMRVWRRVLHARIGVWFDMATRIGGELTVKAYVEADVVTNLHAGAFGQGRQGLRPASRDDQRLQHARQG
jgi:hypothetical protein